jgi:hypothetical protein
MEITKSISNFTFEVILKLSEKEARALKAITEYGIKNFTEVFYEKLGKSVLAPYEDGLKELFETAKEELPKHLSKFDKVRKVWTE